MGHAHTSIGIELKRGDLIWRDNIVIPMSLRNHFVDRFYAALRRRWATRRSTLPSTKSRSSTDNPSSMLHSAPD